MEKLQKIIKQCIDGEESAQRELYLMYRSRWYKLCLRYGKNKQQSDDIFQEGLIQIYQDLYQFDVNRASFYTWSCRLMSHAAIRYLKKDSWHQTFVNLEEVYEPTVEKETIFDKIAAEELIALIQKLPKGYRIVFNMYVLEGYNHREIAEQLGITAGTSKSQLYKAKKMLQELLNFQLETIQNRE